MAIVHVPRWVFVPGSDPDLPTQVERLEQEPVELRRDLEEAQERIDGTERGGGSVAQAETAQLEEARLPMRGRLTGGWSERRSGSME